MERPAISDTEPLYAGLSTISAFPRTLGSGVAATWSGGMCQLRHTKPGWARMIPPGRAQRAAFAAEHATSPGAKTGVNLGVWPPGRSGS